MTWVGGTPGPNALAGLSSVILGDGVATELPTGPSALSIERLILEPGESVPESTVPTMLSLESGRFDFTTVSGNIQVSRTATPGPQDPAELDEEFSLAPGDASILAIAADHATEPHGRPVFDLDDVTGIARFIEAALSLKAVSKVIDPV